MQLEAGYRLGIAPRFHSPVAWPERLRLNGGSIRIEGRLSPEPTWRPATDAELAVLLAEGTRDDPPLPEEDVWERTLCVFTIPEHLRSRWWELAARQVEPAAAEPHGIETFAQAVLEFAQFKRLLLPSRCSFDEVLTPPGQAAPRTDGTAAAPARTVAGINLGDERTSVVFLNLSPARMAELLNTPAGGPGADLSGRFLAAFPTYPLVRLFLEPGEGVRLPAGVAVWDGYTLNKQEIDVWLVIREAGGS